MKENNCSFTILSFYKVLYITSVVHMPSEITVVFCHIRVGTASVAYINQPISNKLVRKGLLFAVLKKVRQDVAALVNIDDSDQPAHLSALATSHFPFPNSCNSGSAGIMNMLWLWLTKYNVERILANGVDQNE